ncbi:MAG: pilus assembly protein [Dinoroseobacter sp.]|nr:pilus assembly protein [Dinoroseobacter sp.]
MNRFRNDEHGAILPLFAFMIVPLIIIVGFAMEMALGEYLRSKVQGTTDSASLAAADLEQTLDPEDVVNDFFAKADLTEYLTDVDVVNTIGERTVTVTADAQLNALLTKLAGLNAWDIPVAGRATETRGDIEIAVVLDNSGSMSWEPPSAPPGIDSRMELLIPAAEAFVDAVQPQPGEGGTTTISLVPFSSQVSVGEDMLDQFSASSEHDDSHCVSFFSSSDYDSPAVSPSEQIRRTAFFDPRTYSSSGWGLDSERMACPTDSARRDIYAWSERPGDLKARIRAMEAYGNTSIEHATKWAVALLDPSLRPVLTAMAGMDAHSYMSGPAGRGQPYDYGAPNTFKYLIVMSDGENTLNWDIRDGYREGSSPVWKRPNTREYYYYRDRAGRRDWYRVSNDRWYRARQLPGDLRQLTWPEVWAEMPVKKFVLAIKAAAVYGVTEDDVDDYDDCNVCGTLYDEIVTELDGSWKNDRTEEICTAAKNAGITIFTIGMDTYGQGDTTLSNCASSPTLFYDVQAVDISSAFSSIARQINKLRLTQ